MLENGDEYTYEGEYGYEYEHIYDCDNVFPPRQCPSDSSCVVRTECGSKGKFSNSHCLRRVTKKNKMYLGRDCQNPKI